MGINSPESQKEDYKSVWQKVYRIIALILLVSMFLYLVDSLMLLLGISVNAIFVLLSFPFPLIR